MAGMELGLPIGDYAARVGLTVSALRFYDDAAVLKPVRVDGSTGYRYYSEDQVPAGLLLRQLRAAGMPLAAVREVLAAPPGQARRLIHDHSQQVERRLEDARSSASAAIRLLDSMEDAMTTSCTVDGAELKTALSQVLHAAPGPETTRVPDGVLLAIQADALRLAATDGHRLAIRDLATRGSGEATAVLDAQALRRDLEELKVKGSQSVEVADGRCRLGALEVPVLEAAFPDYQRILPDHRPGLRASFEVGRLRRQLQEGEELAVLRFEPGSVAVGFNRDYLLQALEATRGPDVLMEADGPHAPCLIRSADEGSLTYLLMPIRLLTPA
jgi:DNA-binding transcriptional MerR regulator